MRLFKFLDKVEEILLSKGYEIDITDAELAYPIKQYMCTYYYGLRGNNGFVNIYQNHDTRKQVTVMVQYDTQEVHLNKKIVKFSELDSFDFIKFEKLFKTWNPK